MYIIRIIKTLSNCSQTIVTAPKRPKKQKLITVPMMTANNTTVPMLATNNASAVPAQPLLAGQPIQVFNLTTSFLLIM